MKKHRKIVRDKSGGRCWYCGSELPEKGWHIDHVDPVQRMPQGHHYNLDRENDSNKVAACASCNIQKADLSIEGFRKKIEQFIYSLNSYHTQYVVAKRYGLIKETDVKVEFWFEREGKHEQDRTHDRETVQEHARQTEKQI
ncbi:HNH endonuclease signature motif containing protein [Natribacillus halophilus]|uniref:HNH endonuclease n=1 Tax=Natribacillus halophilus TaxID=549003 RepID=UPI000B82DB9C